jgi:hypothetical protein
MILVCAGVICLGLFAWLVAARVFAANSMRSYERQPAPEYFFEQRPFLLRCEDRPQPLPPGVHSWFSTSNTAPYARTRLETLDVPLTEVPALTIASEPMGLFQIAGEDRDDWKLQFCAIGEGDSVQEARQFRDGVSMTRTGALITLHAMHPGGRTGGSGDLIAQVPRDAPLTVYTIGTVALRNLSGPLRITAVSGRATILNTTGTVDADGGVVDFSGARGFVTLNSNSEIDIKLTGFRFLGNLSAYGQREVRVLVPRGFESPIEVMVNSKKDLVCRADFCSRMRQENRAGAHISRKYADNSEAALDHVFLRSDHSTVVIDNWYGSPIR